MAKKGGRGGFQKNFHQSEKLQNVFESRKNIFCFSKIAIFKALEQKSI